MFYRTIFSTITAILLITPAVFPQEPLFKNAPFDRVTLNEAFESRSFDLLPIIFEGGQKPERFPRNGELPVRLLENPAEEYLLEWSAIAKIETFDEMVYAELDSKLSTLSREIAALGTDDGDSSARIKGDLDEVYDYFEYFSRQDRSFPQIENALRRYIYLDAALYTKTKDWTNAAARFERLYEIAPNYPDLENRYSAVTDQRIKERFEAQSYRSGREILDSFAAKYPENRIIKNWSARYERKTEEYLDTSRKGREAGDWWAAHRFSRLARETAPNDPSVRADAEQLFRAYPIVVIGVGPDDSNPYSSRTDRRTERLLQRTLFEFAGTGVEGGLYESPFGNFSVSENRTELKWTLTPGIRWAEQNDTVSELDLAETLLDSAEKSPVWEELFESISIDAPYRLTMKLRRPNLRPEALLQIPLVPASRFSLSGRNAAENDPENEKTTQKPEQPGNGPFVRHPGDPEKPEVKVFVANERYSFPRSKGPKLIEERIFADPETVVEAFLKGEIDLIEKLAPWQIAYLKTFSTARIEPYSVRSIHFLVPNLKKPLSGLRTFRRGLLYGINRERIIEQLQGKSLNAELISGPMLKGTNLSDPLGYGYDLNIPQPFYEPKVALVLALLAASSLEEFDSPGNEPIPEIVLAHPPDETARVACMMIQRQWKAIGIPCRLVPYYPEEPIGRGTAVDFWYVSYPVREPLSDALAVLSGDGLAGGTSPYMALALEKLRLSTDWPDAAARLREIHRLCAEEVTMIPLWQWTEHYAVRRDIQNIGTRERSGLDIIYRNVENWTVPFR